MAATGWSFVKFRNAFSQQYLEYVDIPCYNKEVKFDANRQREGFLC